MAVELPLGVPLLTIIVVILSVFLTHYRSRDPLLDAIPTIGYSDPILSYLSAFRYCFLDGQSMVREGYEKAKPGLFKIPTFHRWVVLPAGAKLVEDVKKASDDVLSKREPAREIIQADYTVGLWNGEDTYIQGIVRSRLIRNTAATIDKVNDEITKALGECIPATSEEWVKISTLPTMQRIICRTTSRIFVGAPLCWNRDYQKLATNFAVNVMKVAFILYMFPKPLKPIVARIFSNVPSQIQRTMELIKPIVKERIAKMDQLGDTWEDAPNDMLMWLMSEAKEAERSLEVLARRLLIVNLPALHTTSNTCTQVLYRLLTNPEYIEPLRQEVEAAIEEEGWTKAGMDKMHKIDSFVRETQRFDSLGIVALNRLALRPFTFSNGVTIPAGTLVALPLHAIHMEEETYPNPEQFDGFRFSKLCDSEGAAAKTRHIATSTATDYLPFGLGRHACPGRFFAVSEIKALLAHIILAYDIRLGKGKGLPHQFRFGSRYIPRNADLLFRKRQR